MAYDAGCRAEDEKQLDMQTLHRIRDQLFGECNSLMTQITSLLFERGHVMPQGCARLAARLGDILEADEPVLGACIQRLVADMCARYFALDERIAELVAGF